jgi:DNA-binding transcriptional LysR family regulator
MNINFELYKTFYHVAKNENITKASKELFISQPAVSKAIKSLEEQLGGELFFRNKKGVILTQAGEELFLVVQKMMEELKEAETQFKEHVNFKKGIIKIGVSTTIARNFLLDYLRIFHDRYPEIEIKIDTNPSYRLFEKLANGFLDVIFLSLPYDIPSNVETKKIMKIQDCLITSIENSIEEIELQKLDQYPLILQSKNSNTREFLDNLAKENHFVFKPTMELSSYSLVIDFVKMGLGFGFGVKEFLPKEEVKIVKTIPEIPSRYIASAVLKNKKTTDLCQKLMDIIDGKY